MTPEQRQLLDELYPLAQALPESKQIAFLRERCEDGHVRSEIERLLRIGSSDHTTRFRERSTQSVSHPTPSGLAPTTPLAPEELEKRSSGLVSEGVDSNHFEIPDYELVRCIGRGAFGSVWLARSATGVFCALKVVPKDQMTEVEFEGLRSFQTHSRGHSAIIDIRHVGKTPSCFYYVMELADGYATSPTFSPDDYSARSLHDDIARQGPIPVEDAVEITRKIAGGLKHLHEHDLLHRDVKPGNIVFVNGEPQLADLGLLTQASQIKQKAYTPQYAPPEGIQDRSGDLYCLGKTLLHMVSGVSPADMPQARDGLSAAALKGVARIEPVVAQACSADPQSRFQTAGEFVRKLEGIVPLWKRFEPRSWLVIGSLFFLVLVATTYFARPSQVELTTSLYVEHYRPNNKRMGLVGINSPQLPLNDRIAVGAVLEPALHCYLIVLYPDGNFESWHPRDRDSAPPQSKRIEAPLDSEGERVYWILEEGSGYHAVVLVGSRSPLLAFDRWIEEIGEIPWKPCQGVGVWERKDKETWQIVERGPTKDRLSGPPRPFEEVCEYLERIPGIDIVQGIAFPVVAR